MERVSNERRSNIVVGLDFPFESPVNREGLFSRAARVLEKVHPYVCAVKFNHHLVLPLGVFDGVQRLVESAHDKGLLTIMDCKLNDIGSTNQVIADYYYEAGFDALIANPFIGWDEGLQPVFEVAHRLQRGVILLVYMSHKGAEDGYGQTILDPKTGERTPQYVAFARRALKVGADGVIVGATYPEKIREVFGLLGDIVPIFSPGIGVQGGDVTVARKAGARYLIVVRSIVQAEDPAAVARKMRDAAMSGL
jgi:orotidine-5'-phosphate decarboxylase